ncbi:hypothetical protein CMV_018050 [Castanea mollissima]|uniref:Uncharacterized protein n=1 Tax=Castanea mollissima TaxID=60419 RepID=A0A8J4QQ08_9ROSI|nr:hypothetical protein CMV_018050 [Castanea mollissima]
MNLSTPSNNPNTNRNPPSPSPKTQSECSNCGKASQSGGSHKTDTHNQKWAQFHFHHVRLRGVDRLLCTSCVLRLHPSSFCPLCFDHFTPPNPSIHNLTPCSKCSSLTHSHCLPTTTNPSSSSSYLCPPCSDPNFSFFQFQPHAATRLDTRSAAVLLCAARIASASMAKAAAVARADAERKVREAAAAKKRARDAMEHLAMVEAKAGRKDCFIENKNKDGVLSNGNLKSLESVVPKNTTNNRKLEVECRASNANGKENES